MNVQKKIGFFSVLSLVVGAQIGTGVMTLPNPMASLGLYGQFGWFISFLSALCLAFVFADLCSHFPKTGGPHVYVAKAFGTNAGFLTAWSYWIVSWVSTCCVIVSAVAYLEPFTASSHFGYEWGVFGVFLILNLLGMRVFAWVESLMFILKVAPLIIVPLALILKSDHTWISVKDPFFPLMIKGALLTFWGFLGVEGATAPAQNVENPKKTIPLALILGTTLVGSLYILNSFSFHMFVDPQFLKESAAPYASVVASLFGSTRIMNIVGALICMGTMNSWILISAQVGYGAAQSGFFHRIFLKCNAKGSPVGSILLSSIGIFPILYFSHSPNLADQINAMLDISILIFIIVYAACCVSHLFLIQRKEIAPSFLKKVASYGGLSSCTLMLFYAEGMAIFVSLSIIMLGTIFLIVQKRKVFFRREKR